MFSSRESGWSLSSSTSATRGLAMTIRLSTRRVWMIRDCALDHADLGFGLVDLLDQVVDVPGDLLDPLVAVGSRRALGDQAGRVARKQDHARTAALEGVGPHGPGTGSSGMTRGRCRRVAAPAGRVSVPAAAATARAAGWHRVRRIQRAGTVTRSARSGPGQPRAELPRSRRRDRWRRLSPDRQPASSTATSTSRAPSRSRFGTRPTHNQILSIVPRLSTDDHP